MWECVEAGGFGAQIRQNARVGQRRCGINAEMAEAESQVWRVGAIMNEPLPEVLKFCAWYLALGADEVVICFDNPDDPAINILSDHPRLRCISCTPAF